MGSKTKNILKYIFAKISKITGATNLFYKLNKDRKKILAYHNVIPDKYFKDYIHLDHSIRESQFRKHLEVINKRYNVGIELYKSNEITLTFDDGYKNQYLIASKILGEYDMKGYFFYSADLLKDREILLIDKIQYWLDHTDSGKYESKKYNLSLKLWDVTSRREAWNKIQILIKNKVSFEEICDLLNDMFSFENINMNKTFYNLRFKPIKKHELKNMKENGHKIGAHSSEHNILSYMKSDNLSQDIDKCKKLLDEGIYNTATFCYPFGGVEDVSDEVMKLVECKGFKNALAFVNTKLINREYGRYFIPRMTLPSTYDEDYIDFVLSGAYYFFKNGRLLPTIKENNNSVYDYE